jgi:hypothetical protein
MRDAAIQSLVFLVCFASSPRCGSALAMTSWVASPDALSRAARNDVTSVK